MAKGTNPTTKFKVDISDLQKNITQANRLIRLANSEFKAASDGTKDWEKSADGLSAKLVQMGKVIDAEQSKLDSLEEQKRRVVEAEGEHSKAAQELTIKINNQKAALNKSKASLAKYQSELDALENATDDAGDSSQEFGTDLKEVGDEAENTESRLSGLASTLAGGIASGFKAVIAGATALVGAFLATGEASQEHIEDMGKLETAYKSAGKTVEDGQAAYKGFVGILGETDQAVEAVNHLAKLTKSQEELAAWTDIAAGVYATFGDSLPLEGLTEAANETAKVGAVTGPLADALNWAGVSEDAFNAKLAATNSEAERAQLITSTLTGLYQDAGTTYQEVNADLIAARQAQANLNDAMAQAGQAAMPVTTAFKNIGATILNNLKPQLDSLGSSMLGILSGDEGAAQQFGDTIGQMLLSGVNKAAELAPTMASVGVSVVTSLITGVVQSAPQLATSIGNMISSGVQSISANGPKLLQAGISLVQMIGQGIMQGVPLLIQTGASILDNVGSGIATNLPNFVNYALDALDGFADMLTENLPTLIKSGADFIKNLVQGFVDSLPTFLNKAPEIISKFANLINDNIPTILKAGVDIIITLGKGLIKAIPDLIANIPKIITAIVDVWMAFNWVQLGKNAITFLKDGVLKMVGQVKTAGKTVLDNLVNALKSLPSKLMELGKGGITSITNALKSGVSMVKGAAKSIFDGVVNTVKGLPDKLLSIGKDLVRGLWNGISDMTGWVIGKIQGFGENVLSGIKDFFGVHSPATSTAEIGGYLSEGLAVGVESKVGEVISTVKNLVTSVLTESDGVVSGNAEKIGVHLAEEVAAGIGKTQSEAEKKAQELGETILSAAQQKLDNFKVYNDMTLKEEMEFWDEIRKQVDEGTQARIDADKRYIEARKAYESDMQASIQRVTDVMRNAESEREKAYDEYDKKVSAAREKYEEERTKLLAEAEQDRADLQASYAEKVNSAYEKYQSDKAKLTEQYESDVNKILEDKAEQRQAILDKYNQRLKQRTEQIYDSLGLFDNFDISTDQTADDLLGNLQSQVDGMKDWQADLSILEGRGLDDALLAELQAMGPKAAAQIDLLANMTDAQLSQYVALWQQKMTIAESAAKLELKPVLEQTNADLAQLNLDTQLKLEQLATTYKTNLDQIGADLNTSLMQYKVDLDTGMLNIENTLRANLAKIKTDLNQSLAEYEATLDTALASIESSVTSDLEEMGANFLALVTGNIAETGDQAAAGAQTEGTRFVNTMQGAVAPLTPALNTIGGQAMNGFWNGMRAVANRLEDWFEDFCESLIEEAESVLEIGSPSKVFKRIGEWTVQGFANGVNGESKNLLSTTGKAFRGVVDTARGVLSPAASGLRGAGAGVGGAGVTQTAKTVNYNFHQTNNSPRALSRIEIYRQSKNLLKGAALSV